MRTVNDAARRHLDTRLTNRLVTTPRLIVEADQFWHGLCGTRELTAHTPKDHSLMESQ